MGLQAYKIQALFPFPDSSKDIPHPPEIAHIARQPFNLRILACFLLDLVNSFLALLFLAVDHDYTSPVEHEGK